MFKKTMTAVGLAMIVATPVLAVEGPFPVREVDASTHLEAFENPNALDYYPDVAADVDAAVAAKVDAAPEDAEHSLGLSIKVTALRLNDNPVLTDDGKFNIMEGVVVVYDKEGDSPLKNEAIILRAEEMPTAMPAFSPDNRDFYIAMVDAFADRTAEIVEGVDFLPDTENNASK